jgi:hypothetical protein
MCICFLFEHPSTNAYATGATPSAKVTEAANQLMNFETSVAVLTQRWKSDWERRRSNWRHGCFALSEQDQIQSQKVCELLTLTKSQYESLKSQSNFLSQEQKSRINRTLQRLHRDNSDDDLLYRIIVGDWRYKIASHDDINRIGGRSGVDLFLRGQGSTLKGIDLHRSTTESKELEPVLVN